VVLSRRDFLGWTVVGSGAVALGNLGSLLAASPASAARGLGEPVPDPAGVLDLPAGFSYRIVSRAGDPLPGGGTTPGRHDGTASFGGDRSGLVLVQNHEIGASDPNPTLASPELTYDPKAKGGTTTLRLDQHLDRMSTSVSPARGRTAPAASHRGAAG
jgi:secreted PhoX family phosphatase